MPNARILIVENDLIVAQSIEIHLKSLGYEVPAMVVSGEEAVRKTHEIQPDLVLMDIKLPGEMDGVEAAEQIRRRFDIPVIYLTAYADDETLARAKITDPFGYILKPFGGKELHSIVEMALYKHQTERALRQSEHRYKRLLESVTDYIYTVKIEDGQPVDTSHGLGCEAVTGYTQEEYAADPNLWYQMIYPEDREAVTEQAARLIAGETVSPLEHRLIHKDGSLRWVRNTPVPRYDQNEHLVAYDGLIADITERKRMEEEREKLQAQLFQAQKMEAIGRLTGGIAHDFNNLLTAINGFAELAHHKLRPDDPLQETLGYILDSGQRAADLIHQLLAFSSKQIIEPKIVSLNSLITDLEAMLLRRIIGEDIQIVTTLASDLWPIKIDPAQVEQIVLNLAVNARDAMPDGGKLTIETANVVLDDNDLADQPEIQPGEYVLLAVSDTGKGISEAVLGHIFEPFFTTKERDKGTGLGLATVYGIVKQNEGDIKVYSEEGQGTSFKIYLPRTGRALQSANHTKIIDKMLGGSETILLVEDDAQVCDLAKQVLEEQGYKVFETKNGREALQLAGRYADPIHLLLTDVVMPDMNGKALAEQLLQTRPNLKTIFISGYTDETIAHHGVSKPGIILLQKPFSPTDLARKVREILDTS